MSKRCIVTLDPEFLPWSAEAPNVKLRHNHNKAWEFIAPIIVGVLMIGGMLLYTSGAFSKGSNPTIGGTAGLLAREGADSATVPPVVGALVLVGRDGSRVIRDCESYRVVAGNEILSMGTTEQGAVINIGRRQVEVWCDGQMVP